MAYNNVVWSMSGFVTQQEAEKKLEEMIAWAHNLPNKDKWSINSSVNNGAYGWKAALECEYNG